MSELLLTSDSHLLHPLVSSLRGFETVEEHTEWFCDMWVSQATKRSRIVIAGDLSAGNRERFEKVLCIIDSLPGRKVFVSGNHDHVHPDSKEAPAVFRRWAQTFEFIGSHAVVRINGRRIDVSHFPRLPDKYDIRERDGRMVDIYGPYRVPDTGRWLVHGHTHHNDTFSGERQIHVGLDGWGRLVTEGDIAHIIREAEAGRMVPENRMNSDSIVLDRKR